MPITILVITLDKYQIITLLQNYSFQSVLKGQCHKKEINAARKNAEEALTLSLKVPVSTLNAILAQVLVQSKPLEAGL